MKTAISQELMVAVTWNWHTKCPTYMCTVCQNFSSLSSSAVQKLLPKVFHFDSFQDPCPFSFQDHHILLKLGYSYMLCVEEWEIFIWNLLSRPSFWDIHTHFSGKTDTWNADLDHFKTLVFSLITAQWQVDSSYFNHCKFDWNADNQQLAFAWVERSDHTCISPRSIKHSTRKYGLQQL